MSRSSMSLKQAAVLTLILPNSLAIGSFMFDGYKDNIAKESS